MKPVQQTVTLLCLIGLGCAAITGFLVSAVALDSLDKVHNLAREALPYAHLSQNVQKDADEPADLSQVVPRACVGLLLKNAVNQKLMMEFAEKARVNIIRMAAFFLIILTLILVPSAVVIARRMEKRLRKELRDET